MTPELYPCFLTVKKLIYMIDGSLHTPFFARNQDGSIFGSQSTTDWHNESKNGAFMINRYLKEDYDYTNKLKKLGKIIVESENLDETEKKKFFDEENLSENEEDDEDLENDFEVREANRMLTATKEEKHYYFKS